MAPNQEEKGHENRKSSNMLGISTTERRLFASVGIGGSPKSAHEFTGMTELFFLMAGLLRVSLFPCIGVNEEYSRHFRGDFSYMSDMAEKEDALSSPTGGGDSGVHRLPVELLERFQKRISVYHGFATFLDDPELVTLLTRFSLLQLEWLAGMAHSTNDLRPIPEWFLKLPAQWIAHVARIASYLMEPLQGELAVQYATQLLQIGTAQSQEQFSPAVLTELIRIAGTFVAAGVNRARARVKAKLRGRGLKPQRGAGIEEPDFERDIIDDRQLDIYTSFDAKDLGVTVFTNQAVAKLLGPTLISTYT